MSKMGWFKESYRHSLAAKGIKTGRMSYSLFEDIDKYNKTTFVDPYRSGVTALTKPTEDVIGKERTEGMLLEGATKAEQKQIDKERLFDALRERETRQQLVSNLIFTYVKPKRGQNFKDYVDEAKKFVSESVPLYLKSTATLDMDRPFMGPRAPVGRMDRPETSEHYKSLSQYIEEILVKRLLDLDETGHVTVIDWDDDTDRPVEKRLDMMEFDEAKQKYVNSDVWRGFTYNPESKKFEMKNASMGVE